MSYNGHRSQVGFQIEAVPGVKAATLKPYSLDIKMPIGFRIERDMIDREVVRGAGSRMKKLPGLIKVPGSLNAELYTRQSGWWYWLLMGGATSVATTQAADATLQSAIAITPTRSITTQPTVANKLKLDVIGATAWGKITITGTDGLGNNITEALTWTANAIKTTSKWFKTVNAGGIITSGFTGGTLAVIGNAGTYTHVFTLTKPIPTITVEESKGGMPWTYWGNAFTSSEIKIPAVEGVAEISCNTIGRNGEPKSIIGGTEPALLSAMADEVFMNWNMQFKIDGAVVKVQSININFDKQLKDNTSEIGDYCQEALPRHVSDNNRQISGTFNCAFENANYYNKFINRTPASLSLLGINQAPAGPYESVLFELPEVVFEGTDPEVGDMGELRIDVPFSAFSTLGADDEFKITMVTTLANFS